jgi:two-component system response regulator MtrA
MAHILAVDDDPVVREAIRHVLIECGHVVTVVTNGQQALDTLRRIHPDLVILDIMMPEISGLEVCRRIRADPYLAKLPVIFLTSKDRPTDVAEGLNAGGDDFLSKTAIRIELPARLQALLRRMPGGFLDPDSDYLVLGDMKLHTVLLEVDIGDRHIQLTPVEHRLMRYLMGQNGQPASTDQLLEEVWGYHEGTGDPKLVRVSIARLRAKIEPQPDDPQYILNIRGRGYLLNG